ncbi:hypothetical protein JW930_03215 [Candidatus Woesearchaeota archaeon]|nr:hypothetical protein [Candidatus Woesearchaeota archaeon]
MLKTNADLILELLQKNKEMAVSDIAKKLGTTAENVQKTAEYLEEEGKLKVEFKFMKPHLILVEKPGDTGHQKEEEKIPVAFDQNILDTNVETSSKSAQPEDNFSPLEESDLETQFPQDISSAQMPEPQEEVKKPEQVYVQAPATQKPKTNGPEQPEQKPYVIEKSPEQPKDYKNEEIQEKSRPNYSNVVFKEEPDYNLSTADDIEEAMKQLENDIANKQYSNLNLDYKELYEILQHASLSEQERTYFNNKLAGLFHKIKKIYITEEIPY